VQILWRDGEIVILDQPELQAILERRNVLRRGVGQDVLVKREELPRALALPGRNRQGKALRSALELRLIASRQRLRKCVLEPLDQSGVAALIGLHGGRLRQRFPFDGQLRLAGDADLTADQPGHLPSQRGG